MSTIDEVASREDHFVVFRAFEKAGIKVTWRGRNRINRCLSELLKVQEMHSDELCDISLRIENHRDRSWNKRQNRTPEEKRAVCVGYTNSRGGRCNVCLWCIITVRRYVLDA